MSLSLKGKFVLLVFFVSMVCPVVAGIIIYRNNATLTEFKKIADESLPRTGQMGAVLATFRQLRIEVRSLALKGNSAQDIERYLKNIDSSMKDILREKASLNSMMGNTQDEIEKMKKLEDAWKDFESFGGEILLLHKKGDEASLSKMADMIREICPKLAAEFDSSISEMLKWQKAVADKQTVSAMEQASKTANISLILAVLGITVSLVGGVMFSSNIVRTLTRTIEELNFTSNDISSKSDDVASISSNLSEAASQQAASLQETVSSIDEISAMVKRNSDSAATSVRSSENSKFAAEKGKEKVSHMIDSIHSIAAGNKEIMDQMQRSNKEISEIVVVIKDIAQKTQVINDIVFQTKLLSFNASVEAARAGEHGKGFAVVAEEVGNLAAMSGKAANEITDMLTRSVKRVSDIVENTSALMDNLIKQSTEKVELGTSMAKECAESLDEILLNVSEVNELLKEISTASSEQSSGIGEVNKAMIELDQVTQQNSTSANQSSQAAGDLNLQVERLNTVVTELTRFVDGKSDTNKVERFTGDANVVQLQISKKQLSKKIV